MDFIRREFIVQRLIALNIICDEENEYAIRVETRDKEVIFVKKLVLQQDPHFNNLIQEENYNELKLSNFTLPGLEIILKYILTEEYDPVDVNDENLLWEVIINSFQMEIFILFDKYWISWIEKHLCIPEHVRSVWSASVDFSHRSRVVVLMHFRVHWNEISQEVKEMLTNNHLKVIFPFS